MEIVIEYPASGATYRHEWYGVYGYDTYPENFVLAGLERRRFLDSFSTLEEAQAAYPDARWDGNGSSGYRELKISISYQAPEWFDPADAGESWTGE